MVRGDRWWVKDSGSNRVHLFKRLSSAREDLKFVIIINLWSSKIIKITASDRTPRSLFLTNVGGWGRSSKVNILLPYSLQCFCPTGSIWSSNRPTRKKGRYFHLHYFEDKVVGAQGSWYLSRVNKGPRLGKKPGSSDSWLSVLWLQSFTTSTDGQCESSLYLFYLHVGESTLAQSKW